ERIVTGGCCGDSGVATVNLVAGKKYQVAFGVEDTGGGSGLGVQFMEPNVAGATITTLTDVTPGAAAQAGLWSFTVNVGGGTINVGGGATLKVSSVTGNPDVNLNIGGFREAFFSGGPSQAFLNPINTGSGLLTQTPVVVKSLTGPLSFDISDGNTGAQLNAES